MEIKDMIYIFGILMLIFSYLSVLALAQETPTREYNNEQRRLIIQNSTDILINETLETPLLYNVHLGHNVKVAQWKITEYTPRNKPIFDNIYSINLDTNQRTTKEYTYKYLIIDNRTQQETWIPINTYEDLPRTNDITIGMFTNITQQNERMEWIPQIEGYNITEWATYYAQSNTLSVVGEINITLANPVNNISQTMVLVNGVTPGTTDDRTQCQLLNTTTLNCRNTNTADITFFVVENTDFKVQTLGNTFGTATLQNTITLNNTIENVSQAFIIRRTLSTCGSSEGRHYHTTIIKDNESINISRGIGGATCTPETFMQVVEWNNSNVQRGTIIAGTDTYATINEINTTQSFVIYSFKTNVAFANDNEAIPLVRIFNETTLQIKTNTTGSATTTVHYQVITHPFIRTEHGFFTADENPKEINLTQQTNLSSSFITRSFMIGNTTGSYRDSNIMVEFLDNDTIEINKFNTNDLTNGASYSIIELLETGNITTPETNETTNTTESEYTINSVQCVQFQSACYDGVNKCQLVNDTRYTGDLSLFDEPCDGINLKNNWILIYLLLLLGLSLTISGYYFRVPSFAALGGLVIMMFGLSMVAFTFYFGSLMILIGLFIIISVAFQIR